MNELDLHIDTIKKMAFEYSKKSDAALPELNQNDMELFINLTSIYVLHANGVCSVNTAKRLMIDRIDRYKISGMWREIFQNQLERESAVEALTCEMGKNPTVETAMKIVYELIPPLKLQKSKINKALGVNI